MHWASCIQPFIKPAEKEPSSPYSEGPGSSFLWEPIPHGWGWGELVHGPKGPCRVIGWPEAEGPEAWPSLELLGLAHFANQEAEAFD